MKKETGQQPQEKFDEALKQYPDLALARNLFIQLFSDRSPLVNLGYTNEHIDYAWPVLRLLEGGGKVMTQIRRYPYLSFTNPQFPDAESLQIYHLPEKRGFSLFATRDENSRRFANLSPEERLMREIFTMQPVIIFEDLPQQVAHICLFRAKDPKLNSLDYLVESIFCGWFTDPLFGLHPEGFVTKFARRINLAGTYRAAFLDEGTKLEFVIELNVPEEKRVVSVVYRKLNPVTSGGVTMIPIGKKPNKSIDEVKRAFSQHSRQIVEGEFAWSGTSA
ncbi:MAG: hypothetical protein NZM26_01305 [Patescibacteria group bacterium]|nr:hypothetical protein [Patescibacteria group bacterium]